MVAAHKTPPEGNNLAPLSSPRESEASLPTFVTSIPPPKPIIPPAVYVTIWIGLSSSVILFNKWILDTAGFHFPIFLTTWHLVFATIATQLLAKTTHLLDGRKNVKMTGKVYMRAIVPIGMFFSMSLICGNQAYLYLSVSFIQMLKATTPVAVLLTGWGMKIESPNLRILGNVSFIVIGVVIATYGEIAFDATGFLFQISGIAFEAIRLVLVQRLLSSAEYKMDPLVSLYYFAPICAVMNFIIFLVFEGTKLALKDIVELGVFTLCLNALVAFGLNVSVVFLIGKTSSLVLTLCGVLKDILLVCASIMIWGTTVTALQMFGYAIALGGLVYYKLGADKLREHFVRLRSDGSMVWLEYGKKHPAWRKATIAGAVMLFIMVALGGVFHPESDLTIISGEMGGQEVAPPHDFEKMDVPPSILDNKYKATRMLDIVVSVSHKEDSKQVGKTIRAFKNLRAFKGLNPHVTVYFTDKTVDREAFLKETGADSIKELGNVGNDGTAYLTHIVEHWDDLAEHTLFTQADFPEYEKMATRIEDYFVPKTGMLSLGSGHASCACGNCKDPWGSPTTWSRVSEIYSAVYSELCPPSNILLSQSGQFIVSGKRIRGTSKHVYGNLNAVLAHDMDHGIDTPTPKPDEPDFGRTMDRSWMVAFQCADQKLAESCPKLDEKRKKGDADDKCQCLDVQTVSRGAF